MFKSTTVTKFEDLSDELIISIIEYLSLEDLISIFGKLNSRLSCIIFDHPWTHHQLNIQTIDDKTLHKKLDFINTMKLITRISSIKIRPFSIYRSIEQFNQYNILYNFVNLQALSLNNISLEEAESIFNSEDLSKLVHLTHISLIFSLGIEQNDYCLRVERLIAKVLIHPSLRYFTVQTARSLEFSQIQSTSRIEYLNIHYCSFQSLYTLFEFTPFLRHLTATIARICDIQNQTVSIPPLLRVLKLELSIPMFDDLTKFLEKFSKLQKLTLITFSIIEPLTNSSSWFEFITEYLPALTQFKRQSIVALENIATHIASFHWPNGWQLKEKCTAKGANYSQVTIINTRY